MWLVGEHEGGADVRHRIGRVAVMGEAADEADALRRPVAFAAADDRAAGRRGPQIIDAQVHRRLVAEAAQAEPD